MVVVVIANYTQNFPRGACGKRPPPVRTTQETRRNTGPAIRRSARQGASGLELTVLLISPLEKKRARAK